jgi:hypothetical protein
MSSDFDLFRRDAAGEGQGKNCPENVCPTESVKSCNVTSNQVVAGMCFEGFRQSFCAFFSRLEAKRGAAKMALFAFGENLL